jgi:ComF family protein
MRPFERIVAMGLYDDPVKTLIHAMKYQKAWPVAEYLSERLVESREAARRLLTDCDALVPVPLHFTRQLTRGYNQADLIAQRLRKLSGQWRPRRIPVIQSLGRIRATETQTHFHSQAQREQNLREAFAVVAPEKSIRGKSLVLVDDVMTTGATLRSAARELRKAGAQRVCAIVLSVADPRGRGFERT